LQYNKFEGLFLENQRNAMGTSEAILDHGSAIGWFADD
jgi:hypothetical protein